jgi:hypothetical protein
MNSVFDTNTRTKIIEDYALREEFGSSTPKLLHSPPDTHSGLTRLDILTIPQQALR